MHLLVKRAAAVLLAVLFTASLSAQIPVAGGDDPDTGQYLPWYHCRFVCHNLLAAVQAGIAIPIGGRDYVVYCTTDPVHFIFNNVTLCASPNFGWMGETETDGHDPLDVDFEDVRDTPGSLGVDPYRGDAVASIQQVGSETGLGSLLGDEFANCDLEWSLERVDAEDLSAGHYIAVTGDVTGYLYNAPDGSVAMVDDLHTLPAADRGAQWFLGSGDHDGVTATAYRFVSVKDFTRAVGVNKATGKLEMFTLFQPSANMQENPEAAVAPLVNRAYDSLWKIEASTAPAL